MLDYTKHVSTRLWRLIASQSERISDATQLGKASDSNTLNSQANMNRMSRYLENAPEDQFGDFFIVAGERLYVAVTSETAAQIEAVLERAKVPDWIVFDDRVGSRFRVRTSHIRSIIESTAEQRAADRRYERARQREEKEDRNPWEDYD